MREIDPVITRLRQLSGIIDHVIHPTGETSLGQETSAHASALHDLERRRNIRPGSPEWFRVWFTRPFLTKAPSPGSDL